MNYVWFLIELKEGDNICRGLIKTWTFFPMAVVLNLLFKKCINVLVQCKLDLVISLFISKIHFMFTMLTYLFLKHLKVKFFFYKSSKNNMSLYSYIFYNFFFWFY